MQVLHMELKLIKDNINNFYEVVSFKQFMDGFSIKLKLLLEPLINKVVENFF